MKTSEFLRLLKKGGCKLVRHGANHDVWVGKNGNEFTVPRHGNKEIATGTANAILKQAGLK